MLIKSFYNKRYNFQVEMTGEWYHLWIGEKKNRIESFHSRFDHKFLDILSEFSYPVAPVDLYWQTGHVAYESGHACQGLFTWSTDTY